ncbi:helix-turn-helix domain-containing protein [Candidatus Margulisiibacteriota bacterium]
MNDELLTKIQLAELLKIKPRTVAYLTSTRQLPFIKGLGREYRYLKSSVLEWAKQRESKPINPYIEP